MKRILKNGLSLFCAQGQKNDVMSKGHFCGRCCESYTPDVSGWLEGEGFSCLDRLFYHFHIKENGNRKRTIRATLCLYILPDLAGVIADMVFTAELEDLRDNFIYGFQFPSSPLKMFTFVRCPLMMGCFTQKYPIFRDQNWQDTIMKM